MNPKTFDIPDELWTMIEGILPPDIATGRGGRPPTSNYRIMCGVLYRLRTGCQWRAVPERFGTGPTLHRRFQQWVKLGIFNDIFEICLRFYDELRGIDWTWMSLDASAVKAPKGGSFTGRNPTDRGKIGVKRHILTDGHGVPISITVSAANVHDSKMLEETVDAVPLRRGRGVKRPKNLCLDKAYDSRRVETCLKAKGISPHIRRRGEPPLMHFPRSKKRRWKVERANSWHNMWRGLKTRWEKHGANYLACVMIASACIAFQQATDGFSGMF
jgi:putative transposase